MLIAIIPIASLVFPLAFPAEAKTLKRVDDPVVVEGKILKPLLGECPDHLSLLNWTDQGFSPVPFQVDQKAPGGEYAFTQGPKASEDPDPLFDLNDELVFMVTEAGERCRADCWPEGARSGAEIMIRDPLDGGQGWVYLFAFEGKPPRSPIDLVSIDLDFSSHRIHVQTPDFIIESPANAIYPDVLRTVHEDGPGPDILDRLKIRVALETIGGLGLDLDFDELMKCEPTAWIDGTVRALYRADGYLSFSLLKFRTTGYSIITYYPNHMIWPMTAKSSLDLNSINTDLVVYGYMDWNSNIFGTHPYDEHNPYNPEVVWDGKVNDAEKALRSDENRTWIAGIGPEGAIVFRIINVPPQEGIINKLYFMDDISLADPPEDDVGVACMGLKIEGFSDQDPQEQGTSYQYYYYKRSLYPGEEKKILDILDHPLEVEAEEVRQPESTNN